MITLQRIENSNAALATTLACLALFSMAACGDTPPDRTSDPQVRDSAGIQIIESTVPLWEPGEEWRIDSIPLFSLGGADARGPEQFSSIQAAFRDANGRILVFDGATQQIRFFDSTGVFLFAAGRAGDGPGEFSAVGVRRADKGPIYSGWHNVFPWRGDSIAVHSLMRGTMQVLSSDGNEARRWNSGELRQRRRVAGFPGEDHLLLEDGLGDPVGPPKNGWQHSHVLVMDHEAHIDSVGLFPGYVEREVRSPPYGFQRITPGGFLSAVTDKPEFRIFDWKGQLRRIVRFPSESLAFPDAFVKLSEVPLPQRMPLYSRVAADRLGYLWIAPFNLVDTAASKSLKVLSRDGKYLGQVQLPRGIRPIDIGENWILALWFDDHDVQHVRMHRLYRGKRATQG